MIEFPVYLNDYPRTFRLDITQTPKQASLQLSCDSDVSLLYTQTVNEETVKQLITTSFEHSKDINELQSLFSEVLIKNLGNFGENQAMNSIKMGDICVLDGCSLQFITIRGGMKIPIATVQFNRASPMEISNRLIMKVNEYQELTQRLQNEIKSSQITIAQLNELVSQQKEQIVQLQEQLQHSNQMQIEKGVFEVKAHKLEEENKQLQKQNGELMKQSQELSIELSKVKNQHSLEINNYQVQVQNLQEQSEYFKNSYEQLKAQLQSKPPVTNSVANSTQAAPGYTLAQQNITNDQQVYMSHQQQQIYQDKVLSQTPQDVDMQLEQLQHRHQLNSAAAVQANSVLNSIENINTQQQLPPPVPAHFANSIVQQPPYTGVQLGMSQLPQIPRVQTNIIQSMAQPSAQSQYSVPLGRSYINQAKDAVMQSQFKNTELFARLQNIERRSNEINATGMGILAKYSQFMK